MIAIQSFRSDSIRLPLESFGGPAMIKGIITKMALSAVTIARHYSDFKYVTDDAGMNMARECKLPYTSIESVGDYFPSNSAFWVHSKFKAYECSEPFLHFDNDLFLWEPLPETAHKAEVLAFYGESTLWPLYETMLDKLKAIQGLPKLQDTYFHNRTPINMAVFGGTNTKVINEYANEVMTVVKSLNNFNDLDKASLQAVRESNPVLEQLWASYLIQSKRNCRVEYLVPESDIYYSRTTPGIKITHLQDAKKNLEKTPEKLMEVFLKIEKHLKEINPTVYEAVQSFTSSPNNIEELMELA
jgi:hypothetical protein